MVRARDNRHKEFDEAVGISLATNELAAIGTKRGAHVNASR